MKFALVYLKDIFEYDDDGLKVAVGTYWHRLEGFQSHELIGILEMYTGWFNPFYIEWYE